MASQISITQKKPTSLCSILICWSPQEIRIDDAETKASNWHRNHENHKESSERKKKQKNRRKQNRTEEKKPYNQTLKSKGKINKIGIYMLIYITRRKGHRKPQNLRNPRKYPEIKDRTENP